MTDLPVLAMEGDPLALGHAPNAKNHISKHVLENEDILLRIFEQFTFDSYDEAMTSTSRVHLLWAALTCKAFLDPALNVLWKTMNNYIPLLRLLPAFHLIQNEYVIRGAISSQDWERFYYYARKIKDFVYPAYDEENRCTHHAKLRLSQLWTSPLLPTVRRYTCYDIRSQGPFIHSLFISPTIEYLKLGLMTDAQESAVGTLLSTLVDEAPLLNTLHLNGSLSAPSLEYVLQLKNLRSLELQNMSECIDSHFLTLLSGLENLSELSIDLQISPSTTFFVRDGFRQLKKLQITALFSVIQDILTDLSVEVELESLGFVTPSDPLPAGWETHCTSLFNTVCQRWPRSLRQITIDREWGNRNSLALSLSLISPLFRLPNIEHFSVREFILSLTSEDLRELASAWPQLQELHLPFDDSISPQLSFSTLYTLAELCPKLVHLEVPIDFKSIPPLPSLWPAPVSLSLERLFIANNDPPTDTPDLLLIARHFDGLFPRLQKLGRVPVKDVDITTWEKVLAMIHAFRSMRLEISLF